MADFFRTVSLPQAIVLAALFASLGGVAVFAPPSFYERLSETDWPFVAFAIATVGAAVVGVFTPPKKKRAPSTVDPKVDSIPSIPSMPAPPGSDE